MKLTILQPGIFLLTFPTRKALTFTMGRVQEHYEAASPKLRNQIFTWAEFIDEFTKDDGTLDYFSAWSGFNIPGHVFMRWAERVLDPSKQEHALIHTVRSVAAGDFYIIAVREGDDATLDHEIAHAKFYLDPVYRDKMMLLNSTLSPNIRTMLTEKFADLGYSESVYEDELQAFLATSNSDYMENRFGMKRADHLIAAWPYLEAFYGKVES